MAGKASLSIRWRALCRTIMRGANGYKEAQGSGIIQH
jgi:hypothetical protein